MSTIADKLNDLGIVLPEPPESMGSYVPVVQTGNLCFVSGQVPTIQDGKMILGPISIVEDQIEIKRAQKAAKICAINMLAQLKKHLGSLDRVTRIVQIQGFVFSGDHFNQQPEVINGASDFLVEVFGEIGNHTRTAVGVKQLPGDAAVELWGIVEVS